MTDASAGLHIETPRLLLREFVFDDWPAVFAYQNDPRYLRFYTWTRRREKDVQGFVQMFIDWQKQHPRSKYQVAIVQKAENYLIGNCGIRKMYPYSQMADLGYELHPDYWGRGYATEAAAALLQYGFETLQLRSIWAECISENLGSKRVLEKIGMTFESTQRHNMLIKGQWYDTLRFQISRDEWNQLTEGDSKP